MLFRFSLYGFLKNQKYFEPVFYLILLHEKGLSYTMLGVLVGFGSACVNIMEIPSGALADLYGRKRCMIFSFACYIVSFIVFALAGDILLLFAAMFLFSAGEAFRTGTHKAIIFDWLRGEGRSHEKTRVYGFTRSWSKTGSAVSALIGVSFMLMWQMTGENASYSHVFYLCVIPYLTGIINFLGYPSEAQVRQRRSSLSSLYLHLLETFKDALKAGKLRGLFIESMSFEGVFQTVKDYIQPVAYQLAMTLPVFIAVKENDQQTTLLVYSIYFILNVFAIFASRFSHLLSERMGGEDNGCRFVWRGSFIIFVLMTLLLYNNQLELALVVFIVLHVLQNIWRPMQISRFDSCGRPETGATILSIESQAKSLLTIIAAPLLGIAIDFINRGSAEKNLWPVGALGLLVSGIIVLRGLLIRRERC